MKCFQRKKNSTRRRRRLFGCFLKSNDEELNGDDYEEECHKEDVSLESLPSELIAKIFLFLSLEDLAKCELLSKRYKNVIAQYKSYFERPDITLRVDFHHDEPPGILLSVAVRNPPINGSYFEKSMRFVVHETGEITLWIPPTCYSLPTETNAFNQPEDGLDSESAIRSFLEWFKRNVNVIYSKRGPQLEEVPDIPKLKVFYYNMQAENSRIYDWFIWILKSENCRVDTISWKEGNQWNNGPAINFTLEMAEIAKYFEVGNVERSSIPIFSSLSENFVQSNVFLQDFSLALMFIRDLKKHWESNWHLGPKSSTIRIQFPSSYKLQIHLDVAKPLCDDLSYNCVNLEKFPLIQFPDKIPDLMVFEHPKNLLKKFKAEIIRQKDCKFCFAHLTIVW